MRENFGWANACKLLMIFLAMTMPAFAQSLAGRMQPGIADGVAGIVVNETISANGLEFYRNFLEGWREKPDADNYNLDIIERPSRRFGNQIWIMYGKDRVFLTALPIKFDRIRALSEEAVDATYATIITLGMQSQFSADSDMGVDEM